MLIAPLATDTAAGVEVSTSPVPNWVGEVGAYCVPWMTRQLPPLRPLPLKSSPKICVHPDGTGGIRACACSATALDAPALGTAAGATGGMWTWGRARLCAGV